MGKETKKPAVVRRIVRTKLKKNPKLHEIVISLHDFYSKITGHMRVLPDFYIIGAAKCGTTSLYQYLIRHPLVNPGIGKELHYFEEMYYRGEHWYRSCFPFKVQQYFSKFRYGQNFIVGDSTPRYIDHPHVPNRIKNLTPNAKFIVMLRNPIDRAFSHYNMNVKNKYISKSFEEVIDLDSTKIDKYFEFMETSGKTSNDYFLHAYLDRGIYVKRLKEWMTVFPKENFMIIKSEDFFQNSSVVFNDVLNFLQLPRFELDEYGAHMVGKYSEKNIDSNLRIKLQKFFQPSNQELYDFLKRDFKWD